MPDTLDREYVYRCKLCNEIKIGATGNFTICEAAIVLYEVTTKGTMFKPGAVICKTEVHMCKNGDVGLAELIGVRKVLK